jgi:hypothetical protein
MPAIAFTVPIVPGKEEADRQWLQEMEGPRREEYLRSRQRVGVSREVVWHQATPQGTVAIVYMELDDPQRMFEGLGSSNDPFDRWFREKAQEVHGIDLSQPLPGGPPQMVFDGPTP